MKLRGIIRLVFTLFGINWIQPNACDQYQNNMQKVTAPFINCCIWARQRHRTKILNVVLHKIKECWLTAEQVWPNATKLSDSQQRRWKWWEIPKIGSASTLVEQQVDKTLIPSLLSPSPLSHYFTTLQCTTTATAHLKFINSICAVKGTSSEGSEGSWKRCYCSTPFHLLSYWNKHQQVNRNDYEQRTTNSKFTSVGKDCSWNLRN